MVADPDRPEPAPASPPGPAALDPAAGRTSVYHHRVRYFECDQQGVVFNAWYLAWFDEAFGTFLDDGGLGYTELVGGGTDVQLVHTEMDWRSPLRWGDDADVEVRLLAVGRHSFTVGYRVCSGERVVLDARTVYVTVGLDTGGPGTAGTVRGKVPVPAHLLAALGPPVADG